MEKSNSREQRLVLARLCAILCVASIMSALGRRLIGIGPFEDLWWTHFSYAGNPHPLMYYAGITAASCITWIVLAPFLYKSKLWAILPVALVSPFLGALLINVGFLAGIGLKYLSIQGAMIGLFLSGLTSFLMWVLLIQAARVVFPIALITAVLIWLSLNKLIPQRQTK